MNRALRFALALSLFSTCVIAQSPPPARPDSTQTTKSIENDPYYSDALDLYRHGKFVDAMPRFEKLSADYPSDMKPREAWAWCMMQYAATVPDKAQRKKIRARARTIAVQAKELGDNSQILQLMLEQPADGGDDVQFSDRKDIDDAMRAAEAEFARGDMDKAREGYLRVLLIDPNYYDAALFIGDVYYKQQVFGSAGEWFSRAIQIDPNRETAYRYWGDDLAAMGKENDARAKFIDAIVAEPYNNRSWIGLTNWVQRNKVQLNNVQLKQLSKVEVKDDKNVTLTLDANSSSDDPNSVAWMTYGMALAAWRTDEYRKKFPDVPRNRRTLQEEAHALDLMTTVLKEQKNYQEMYKRLDPSLQSLIKIKEAGFLEPFVLINRADAEIAQDYEAYRKDNRELIRRYFDEFVVPKTPSAAAQD